MALAAQTILERSRLFRGLPSATILQISALSIRRSYSIGAIVFFHRPIQAMRFAAWSRAKIRISVSSPSGREIFLNIMEPGDTFGEIALLDGRARSATAGAVAPSEPILTRPHFLELLKREPALVSHVVQPLCERIRWTSDLAEESALLSVPERVARRLVTLGQLHGRETPNGVVLSISQEEMARFLGLSRQAVNRYMQNWKVQGWLTLSRRKIVILD